MCIRCVFVQSRKTCFPEDWRLLVKERIANIGIPLDILGFLSFLWVFGSLRTSLLSIMGELSGGGGTSEVPGMGVNMDRMGRISVRREGCQLLLKRMCSERSER